MLPEHLYIIREILIEKKLHHSFGRLNEIFYDLLTKQTRQLYMDGYKEEFRKAVEFEIDNGYNSRHISHEITTKLMEKLTHELEVAQINTNTICARTGLTKSVVETCLKGHGSLENMMQIVICAGIALDTSSWRGLFEEIDLDDTEPVLTIEPVDKDFYDFISTVNERRIKGDFEASGGLLDFNPTPIADGLLLTITGKLEVSVDEDNRPTNGYFHYVGLKLRIPEKLRKLIIKDYEVNSFNPTMAIDNDYKLTAKELLNSTIINPLDESNDACGLIYLSIRIREDLTVVDRRYDFTFYLNRRLQRFTIKFANEFIEVVPLVPSVQEPSEEDNTEEPAIDNEVPPTEEENVEENTEQVEQEETPVEGEVTN